MFKSCYKDAWVFVSKNRDWELIHGLIKDNRSGNTVEHAWAEKGNKVYDPKERKTYEKKAFYAIHYVRSVLRYSYKEAVDNRLEKTSYGPWRTSPKKVRKVRPVWDSLFRGSIGGIIEGMRRIKEQSDEDREVASGDLAIVDVMKAYVDGIKIKVPVKDGNGRPLDVLNMEVINEGGDIVIRVSLRNEDKDVYTYKEKKGRRPIRVLRTVIANILEGIFDKVNRESLAGLIGIGEVVINGDLDRNIIRMFINKIFPDDGLEGVGENV